MMELTREQLWKLVNEQQDYVLERRRWMHRHPEPTAKEFETGKMIEAEVEKLGLPWERAATTGLLVRMDCGSPGKTVALRADIDALTMPEDPENLSRPKVCVSENPEYNHACGHDAHTSMLLGAMQILHQLREKLSGTILFCFEEGEEAGTGAPEMLRLLEEKYKVDAVWAIHVYANLPAGTISVQEGPRMAGVAPVRATFKGRGGHASRPDQAISPIFAVSDALSNLGSAWINRIDATKTVTLGIGKIYGGTAGNVIPDEAGFAGSMRFLDVEAGLHAMEVVSEILDCTAKMHECTFAEKIVYLAGTPVINDKGKSALAEEVITQIAGAEAISTCEPWFASESFSKYLQKWPGVFAFLGIANEAKGTGAAHHNPKFEVDEDVLPLGVASTVAYTLRCLQEA